MDGFSVFCLLLAGGGLIFGLVQWLRARRQLAQMDRMLDRALEGQFQETTFDESKNISLTVQPAQGSARFDQKWTAEALGNVVDNAVKYTPPGGAVTLSAVFYELFCCIQVSDTGPGVPEGEQARVFGRFYRGEEVRDQEGLGLGLFLTRSILTREGGYVKLSSKPGKGSTFSLYLPLE